MNTKPEQRTWSGQISEEHWALGKKKKFSLSSTEINPMSQCANNRVSEEQSASEALAI